MDLENHCHNEALYVNDHNRFMSKLKEF